MDEGEIEAGVDVDAARFGADAAVELFREAVEAARIRQIRGAEEAFGIVRIDVYRTAVVIQRKLVFARILKDAADVEIEFRLVGKLLFLVFRHRHRFVEPAEAAEGVDGLQCVRRDRGRALGGFLERLERFLVFALLFAGEADDHGADRVVGDFFRVAEGFLHIAERHVRGGQPDFGIGL